MSSAREHVARTKMSVHLSSRVAATKAASAATAAFKPKKSLLVHERLPDAALRAMDVSGRSQHLLSPPFQMQCPLSQFLLQLNVTAAAAVFDLPAQSYNC